MDTKSITTINPKICEFYQSHPHLSFDAMNLLLIDILDHISLQIIPPIKDDLQINNTLMQLSDIKKDYITEISGLIDSTGLSNFDAKHNQLMNEIRSILSSFPAM